MFSNVSRAEFDLKDANDEEVDPWKFIPSTVHTFDRMMIDTFLSYLRDEKQLFVSGEVTLVDHLGTTVFTVVDSVIAE